MSGSSDSPATTTSAADTEAAGAALAARLAPGDVVLLEGEMGAGKTTFVRGAARALGFEGPVTSPTFTIGRRYDGGRLPIAHLDLHRLSGLDDEDPALLEDYLTPDAVAFVEWPEIAEPTLERIAAVVRLAHAGEDHRTLEVEWRRR
ncbi:tRNA (adenosine(37)-N6)-threonylcarbamoyltransferase complex ATPase subunit type 1 TsaE [Conexibacter woesei]|uniref:tRNA (adenosine(37)-N6)-threonylcarbamoyltransferase complex ATPase subunit type 1 TsaE n=1 Tax=Conexibacter woesei TaxID=191495 RepID=UPI00047C02E5|nr:tRNA (adenosine(37)-N6)-threonylcarbamoyltransferase complex ATPase subunit type 1 TsaE [Conexibacter woesei]